MVYIHLKKLLYISLAFLLLTNSTSVGQSFNDITIISDSTEYSMSKNSFTYQNQKHLNVDINNKKLYQIKVIANNNPDTLFLVSTNTYQTVDTYRENNQWIFKINADADNDFIKILFTSVSKQDTINIEQSVFFNNFTSATFNEDEVEAFQDEEKKVRLATTNPSNIRLDDVRFSDASIEYKIVQEENDLYLYFKPKTTGIKTIDFKLKAQKPFVNEKGVLTNKLPDFSLQLFMKPSRIDYLNSDRDFIYFDLNARTGEEIQLDNNRNFQLKKTYRIEDQEDRGGRLIAELFTVSYIANTNKILCRVKPYSLHKTSEGYLYIKDGDRNRFITNFNIIEKPRIDKIHLLHEGQDWTPNLTVFPGQNIEVRIEGTGLKNSLLQFDGIKDARLDTLRMSDETLFYVLNIPKDISKRKITVFMNKKVTPYDLIVKEFQKPTEFDFVYINYDGKNIALNNPLLDKPVLVEHSLRDVTILFDGNKIDKKDKLYGKQFLNIEIRIIDNRNQLLDYQNISNVVVCPGDKSVRFNYYDSKDCRMVNISLNDYLVQKTYNLEPFTQININVSHNETRQGMPGYTRKIKFILSRKINFDMQVAFPAGLLVKRFDQEGYGNLSGISTSVLAQFSFYDPDRIGKLKPYKIGAGFLALNAFNFSDNPNIQRDIGIVIIGSLLPVRKESKFSIPLYAGGGYLLKNSSWFIIFGPGIQFNF